MSNSVLLQGDCLEMLKQLPDNSVDSLITDPPAGIGFMSSGSKDHWDSDKGGRKEWISWMSEVMAECLRVMKPGAHGLVWALPRTSHWTGTALEDAGFQIRDTLHHAFGSGFPKSMDISKAIDKAAGAEREVLETKPRPSGLIYNHSGVKTLEELQLIAENTPDKILYKGETAKSIYIRCKRLMSEPMEITGTPSTPKAKQWQGWGTALKPAHEVWWLIRKPCSEDTVAKNVLLHGTGGINIDASRVGSENTQRPTGNHSMGKDSGWNPHNLKNILGGSTSGRFPANLIFSHNHDCVDVGTKKVKAAGSDIDAVAGSQRNSMGAMNNERNWKAHGTETISAYECTEGCPVAELDRQSGVVKSGGGAKGKRGGIFGDGSENPNRANSLYFDSGGASRFFYVAKASKKDKEAGLQEMPDVVAGIGDDRPSGQSMSRLDGRVSRVVKNSHPTVKSTALMSYLIKMITPPGGIVLDCFMGSGSTGVSAIKNGFAFIGIEKETEYYTISEKRIQGATNGTTDSSNDDSAA